MRALWLIVCSTLLLISAHVIRAEDVLSVVAGVLESTPGSSGDGFLGNRTHMAYPLGVLVDAGGNVFIAEADGQRIRRVDAVTGLVSTVAGNGTRGYSGDGGPATAAQLSLVVDLSDPLTGELGMVFDSHGDLIFTDVVNNRVRKIDLSGGIITTVAGNGQTSSLETLGDNGPALDAILGRPHGLAIDKLDNLYILTARSVRRVDAATKTISAVKNSSFFTPTAIAVDKDMNLYIAVSNPGVIYKLKAGTFEVSTHAGTGFKGFSGDGGPATSAQLSRVSVLTFDPAGNLLIADQDNFRVRRIDANLNIATVIGNGGAASQNYPQLAYSVPPGDLHIGVVTGLCTDTKGNIFIVDGFLNTTFKLGAPWTAGQSQGSLTVSKFSMSFDFAHKAARKQTISFSGTLDGFEGLNPTLTGFNIYLGDVHRTGMNNRFAYLLASVNIKGFEPAPDKKHEFAVKGKPSKDGGVYLSPTANFTYKRTAPFSLLENLASYGFEDATIGKPGRDIMLPVQIDMITSTHVTHYLTSIPLNFTAKTGKSGIAKQK